MKFAGNRRIRLERKVSKFTVPVCSVLRGQPYFAQPLERRFSGGRLPDPSRLFPRSRSLIDRKMKLTLCSGLAALLLLQVAGAGEFHTAELLKRPNGKEKLEGEQIDRYLKESKAKVSASGSPKRNELSSVLRLFMQRFSPSANSSRQSAGSQRAARNQVGLSSKAAGKLQLQLKNWSKYLETFPNHL